MGTEALWVPLLLAGAGAGVSYYNDKSLQKKQDKTVMQGLQKQKATQAEVNKTTEDLLSKFAASNPAADKAKAAAGYKQQLGKNAGLANAGLTKVAGASDEYGADTKNAALGISDYGDMLGSLMSRIDAPQAQRDRESVMTSNYGVGLDQAKRKSQGDARITDLKFDSLHKNPWLSALSAALSGAASGAAGTAGGDNIFSALFGKTPTNFGIPLPGSGRLPGF